MTRITRKGHRIAYRRRGSGPTVLLLHGFSTWSHDYATVAKHLEPDHDVVTFDFLGHGAADKPNPYEYSVAESFDTVEDLFALLGIASSHLVMHDYGGIVGLEQHKRTRTPYSANMDYFSDEYIERLGPINLLFFGGLGGK